MSNVGLGNLATLKAHVLGASLASETKFDTVLAAIGLGVAGQMERFCNRAFVRTVGDTYSFAANVDSVVVPRYPIESISAIAQKDDESEGFVAVDSATILSIQHANGLVHFGALQGTHLSQMRLTYTGGYFFETLEPTDGSYPTATPSGSTALPGELRLAWLLQCQEVWNKRDKLGLGLVSTPDDQIKTGQLQLIPDVVNVLNAYRRFA